MADPLTPAQARLLVALTVFLAAVELAVPVLWTSASHEIAIAAAAIGGLGFLVGALALSASIARRLGVSIWTVLLLRYRGDPE